MGGVLGIYSNGVELVRCTGLCCPYGLARPINNSTTTRLMYLIMLMLGTIISAINLAPGLQEWLKNVPFCKNSTSTSSLVIPDSYTVDCTVAVGYLAVYRISFAFVCFFTLMGLITIGVKTSKDPRAAIQNGFWLIKYCIVIGLIIGVFFIPAGSFGVAWMWVGLIGGLLFILVQLVLLIDFAHSWSDSWIENYRERESEGWFYALLSATCIQYFLSIFLIAFLYINFTQSDGMSNCSLSKFFISVNLILCFIVSAVSILPEVRDASPNSGLLQSAVVSLYTTYLTWSAVANNPDRECNLEITGIIDDQNKVTINTTSLVGLVICMLCILYNLLTSASRAAEIPDIENQDNVESKPILGNEDNGVEYSWSFFHLVSITAALYIMMTLTNWYQPNSPLETLNANAVSMWIKIISSWLCLTLYTWSLIAPIVLSDREFGRSF